MTSPTPESLPQSTALLPIALRHARAFVNEHHRHNVAPQGWLFGVQLVQGDATVGVAIAGRPVARMLQDGRTVEITRLTLIEGAPKNAATRLYGALCRAAKALGYVRAVTYTLVSELATSVRAAGFTKAADVAQADAWTEHEGVNRRQTNIFGEELRPTEAKVRWERAL